MADKLVPSRDDPTVIRRFKDMGDGTWGEVGGGTAAAAGAAGYPAGATPVHAFSGIVANATASAAIPAVAGKTSYLTGLEVTGMGATAATAVALSLLGTQGGTLGYVVPVPAGATVGITPLVVQFNPPIPASGVNQAITAQLQAFGAGNAQAAVTAHGYQL